MYTRGFGNHICIINSRVYTRVYYRIQQAKIPLCIQVINKYIYIHYTYIPLYIKKSTSFIINTIIYQQIRLNVYTKRKREGHTIQNKVFSNFKGFHNEHG